MTIRSTFLVFGPVAVGALSALYACGTSGTRGGQNDSPDGSSAGTTSGSTASGSNTASASGTAASVTDVLQFHLNPTRDGVYTDAAMTASAAQSLLLDATFAPTFTGNIYAQPLYVSNMPGIGGEAFIVATEQNHVTAVDGTGKTIWDQTYDPPVAMTGNTWPPGCGNVKPLGITGTPVVDLASGTLYFASATMVTSPTVKHKIYAVALQDGSVKTGWPIDVETAVPAFSSTHQNQRGALALVDGTLYVPYGGHDGDCTPYFGWVVGVKVADTTAVSAFSTGAMFPTGGTAPTNAEQGGIWSVGGVVSDGTSLFVTTGNTGNNSTVWSGGEAVLRLAAGPTYTNSNANEFHPAEWAMLDQGDLDLGGANPVVFDMPSAPVPHLVAAVGKDGYLYLLNRDSLGGQAGELFRLAVASQGLNGTGAINASPAAYTTANGTYVGFRINSGAATGCPNNEQGNLAVVKITAANPPTAKMAWCTNESGLGSPMVTTGSGQTIVWNASNHLYGYDGDTGVVIFPTTTGTAGDVFASKMQQFNSPIDANGRIMIAGSNPPHLYMFKP